MIPIVDVFAGPGGLGEGFSSWCDDRGRQRFKLAISIEKDPDAHATLRLRAFRRLYGENPPDGYDRLLQGKISWETLDGRLASAKAKAESEALRIELGADTIEEVRALVSQRVRSGKPWVLIGGPPCQAYSLVGRARNKGKADYFPELDHRQTLYVEYLQILADHAPPVFVMENVKGLLSAQVNEQRMFDKIRDDLCDPAKALTRENRNGGSKKPKYEIRALVPPLDLLGDDPAGYVVRSELFGIPQRRHRVILIGVRKDLSARPLQQLTPCIAPTVGQVLGTLPRLRSGLSKQADSDNAWSALLRSFRSDRWIKQLPSPLKRGIDEILSEATSPKSSRGSDYLRLRSGGLALNHSTRGHMADDLRRYMFASSFAKASARSPNLSDFPTELLPAHANVGEALSSGMFSDRFRVQIASQASTTITSHISKDGHYYIHYDASQCRSLTVREAARLQTFPDDYFFCGPRTSQYQQVGNAVPPMLARQIAGVVADLLAG